MFFLLSTIIPNRFKQIHAYNFSEAGHNKSTADGVGAVVKRSADQAIAYGKDIVNINSLFEVLQNKIKKVPLKFLLLRALKKLINISQKNGKLSRELCKFISGFGKKKNIIIFSL